MIKFDIITIFPDTFSYLNESILKRAQKKGLFEIKIHNLRDFSEGRHRKVDDKPYGGGPGMVIQIQPLVKAVEFIKSKIKNLRPRRMRLWRKKSKIKVVLFSPSGKQFDNKTAADLAKKYDRLILICGRYEGVDARVKKAISGIGLKVEEISVGPYVLSGGELPAMILIDAVSRHLPGVLGKEESLEQKRLGVGVPTYTRPEVFIHKGKKYPAPKVLLSGNHAAITEWRVKYRGKKG